MDALRGDRLPTEQVQIGRLALVRIDLTPFIPYERRIRIR